MQSEERWHGQAHRLVQRNASHINLLNISLPRVLHVAGTLHVGVTHSLASIPAVLISKSKEFLPDVGSKEMRCVPTADRKHIVFMKKEDPDYFWAYCNTSPRQTTKVTPARVRTWLSLFKHGDTQVRSIEAFRKAALGLQEVAISKDRALRMHERNGDSCTCEQYSLWRVCPHLLAVQSLVFPGEHGLDHLLAPSHPGGIRRQFLLRD